MADKGWGSWDSQDRSSNFRRPPQHPGSMNSSVPSWERTFCTSVCSIPWGRICAAKSYISTYKNIADWDDEAALEAFQNAKARYWAYINHLPCDIPLPDPDLFIDKVDPGMAFVDPKLLEDLEKEPPPLPDEERDVTTGWDSSCQANIPIVPTGWGDAEEGTSGEHRPLNWDTLVDKADNFPNNDSAWNWSDGWGNTLRNGDSSNVQNNESSNNAWNWGDGWGDNRPRNGEPSYGQNCSWRCGGNNTSWGQHWNNSIYEQGRGNNRKRNRGNYGSRIAKSRHQVNNYPGSNRSWNDYGERNITDYTFENTMHGGQSKSRRYLEPEDNKRTNGSGGGSYWKRNVP